MPGVHVVKYAHAPACLHHQLAVVLGALFFLAQEFSRTLEGATRGQDGGELQTALSQAQPSSGKQGVVSGVISGSDLPAPGQTVLCLQAGKPSSFYTIVRSLNKSLILHCHKMKNNIVFP